MKRAKPTPRRPGCLLPPLLAGALLLLLASTPRAAAQLGLDNWVHLATDGSAGCLSEWSECTTVLANGVFALFPQPPAAGVQSRFQDAMVGGWAAGWLCCV